MLNKYPLWKYLLIAVILSISFIYSAPNLFPDDPAIQITGASSALQIEQADLNRATAALEKAGIDVKSAALEARGGLLRLKRRDDQLPAKDVVRKVLGDEYVVALNLAATTPQWLRALGASPMKLGLDLSGGVHFLLEVDMEMAISARIKVQDSEIKAILRKERVRSRSLSAINNGFQLGFEDDATLNKARTLIRKDFVDFEMVTTERNGKPVLQL